MILRLWNLTWLRKTLRVSSSLLENPTGFPQIPQPRRRRAILGVHQYGAGPQGVPAPQRRTIGVVACGLIGRAATTPMARRRPAS